MSMPTEPLTAFTGKVDVGQGNRTALSLLVAGELGVPSDAVRLVMGDTDLCPYDRGTFGSRSMVDAGPLLRAAAAAARQLLERHPLERGDQRVELASGDIDAPAATVPPPIRHGGVAIVTGSAGYPSDITRPGALHGRALKPPTTGARLRSANLDAARAVAGVTVVEDGAFIGAAGGDGNHWTRP